MRWRVATAFFLILLIIGAGILLSQRVTQLCDQVLQHLITIRQSVETRGTDDSDALQQAQLLWEQHLPFISSIIIHDRVDDISNDFAHARAFLEMESYDEYLASIHELILSMNLLKEYDRPSIRSIL